MIPTIRIQDIADILIMTFLLYQLYSWFRGTRAIQVLLGLGFVTMIFFATRSLDLYMTSWVLQELGTVLIVLIIVVFQTEIRQALYRFSLLRHMLDTRQETRHSQFQDIAETLFRMAAHKTGALIVFQGNESLHDLMTNGVAINGEISPQLLESIFYQGAPFHDGAALICDGKIEKASCHLPLSVNPDLPQYMGTRHRAALGLSERSDAVVVVISEERGDVSLVTAGTFHSMATPSELIAALDGLLRSETERPRASLRQRFFSNMLPKAFLLLGVCVFWVLITTRQGQITSVVVPVQLRGIPENLILIRTMPEDVTVQIKTLSSLTPPPSKLDLTAELDASKLIDGSNSIRVNHSDISSPAGMIITSISPTAVRITAEKKVRKKVPVKISVRGRLPTRIASYRVASEPTAIEIEGPASQVAQVSSVSTEEIDIGRLKTGNEYRRNLRLPDKQITVLRESPIIIRLLPLSRR
ncbi:MAG: diadenylate cyclase CdaA [Desulfuromonadaceae bacterium]|nr:diadenylate cyclase CdaA [Desulfuromonadaceae bacterium]MDD5104653.1 diadenylate cyclase CdaA [Desulfuromonadaceae bacterium]